MTFFKNIYYVFHREFWTILRDHAVLTFFFALTLAYPVVYTFIYSKEVVREVPVTVIDQSKSTLSREFIRKWDATPHVKVISYCSEQEEAKLLMYKKKIYGFLVIPADFDGSIHRGEQAHLSLYCDMGVLLRYKALLTAATDVSLEMGAAIQVQGMEYATQKAEQVKSMPVRVQEVKLYNPQGGFTSFLMPAVLILVIQQSLLLGVGTLAGTARDRRRDHRLMARAKRYRNPVAVVLGKMLAYLPIYITMGYWVLYVVPRLFGITQIGNKGELALFLFPFLLACCFFAIAASFLCKERETPFLLFVFTSVPLMFISGISWPGSAIPWYWTLLGKLFPSTYGITGFVKINNSGATLTEAAPEYLGLWIQAALYFVVSCLLYWREMRKIKVKR